MIATSDSILPTSDGHHDRLDIAFIRRAIREDWEIVQVEWLKQLAPRLVKMCATTEDPRAAAALFKALHDVRTKAVSMAVERAAAEAGGTNVQVNVQQNT